jgi:hypothetical protein
LSTYASLMTLPSDAVADDDCDHRKMRPSPPADTGEAALDESDDPSKRKPYSLLLSLVLVAASDDDFHISLCFS